VTEVDVIVCDIVAQDGLDGLGFSYAIGGRGAPAAQAARVLADEIVTGAELEHPEATWRRLCAACNRTGRGPNSVGLAAIDLALWDLHAKRLDLPLGSAMGGSSRSVAGYGSGGFRPNQDVEEIVDQITRHRDAGFRTVKLRLSGQPQDVKIRESVRSSVPDSVS
jgi:L-alanine-DL-glutamate epimerase-like enolase superfamily enzyme